MDLAIEVTGESESSWDEGSWDFIEASHRRTDARHRVVAMDFGCKHNILRCRQTPAAMSPWCRRTPAPTPSWR